MVERKRRAYKKEVDGLTKTQRYRLKDIEAYRKKKAAFARTPAERERRNKYMQEWKKLNHKKTLESANKSYHKHKHKHVKRNKNYALKYTYGISLVEYEEMLLKQNNKCAICKVDKSEFSKRLCVDHCHKTGKIRGLLCNNCNTILGFYETRLEQIKIQLEEYLKGEIW